MEEFKAKLLLR